jgi:hypothetical protein
MNEGGELGNEEEEEAAFCLSISVADMDIMIM